MYNFDVLKEVQFWRDYLSQGKPRITCSFGNQALVIENTLINANITWPEIQGDNANRMKVSYEEDIFSLNDLLEVNDFDELEDFEELDIGEGEQIED